MHVGRTVIAWFLVLLLGVASAGGARVAQAQSGDGNGDGDVVTVVAAPERAGATSAGTEIVNVARLSYIDTFSGETVEVESNTSRILVSELRRFAFEAPVVLDRLAGESVAFAHRLENVGNVADVYTMEAGNTLADDGDLADLVLVIDVNENGVADPDEPPLDDPVSLAPGESIAVVASGRVDAAQEGGSRVGIVVVARTLDGGLPMRSLADVVRVIASARLEALWGTSAECEAGVPPDGMARLTVEWRNATASPALEREVEVDGERRRGVLLEIALPARFALDRETLVDVMAFRGITLVRERGAGGANWMRLSSWNGDRAVDRLAVLVPADTLERDAVVGVGFGARASPSAEPSDADAPRFVATSSTGDPRAPSEQAVLDCAALGEPASAVSARIRFTRPALALQRALEPPVLARDEDIVDTEFYRLDSGLGGYRLVRDGVYVELVAQVSPARRLVSTNGTAHVAVDVRSRGSGERVTLVLRESARDSSVWRSLVPIRLVGTTGSNVVGEDGVLADDAGAGRPGSSGWCPGSVAPDVEGVPDYTGEGEICVLPAVEDDVLDVVFADGTAGTDVADTTVVDPTGRVFDATTLAPVPGAIITVLDASTGQIARDPLTDEPLAIPGAEDGRYALPRLPAGTFHLSVEPPDGHRFPATVGPGRFESFAVTDASYGIDGYLGDGDGRFAVEGGTASPVIDIPLDPADRDAMLSLEKSATVETVEPGGMVTYRLAIANRGKAPLDALVVLDTPPYGFRYVPGTARLDDTPVNDPERLRFGAAMDGTARGADSDVVVASLRFALGALEPGEEVTLAYELQATPGAIDGDGINTAVASARGRSGVLLATQPSRTQVVVARTGVLSDRAILFGKVYVDASCDGLQNHGEWPIGGVRLYLQDGTFAITDEDGQYSLADLAPGLHGLKIDPLTLPEGLSLKPLDTRNAADPDSRFVELSTGDMHRADFAASCPQHDTAGVFERLAERNRDLQGTWLLEEASRFDPDGGTRGASAAQRADTDGDLSSGLIGEPRAAGTSAPSRDLEERADAPLADASATDAPLTQTPPTDAPSTDAPPTDGTPSAPRATDVLPDTATIMGDPQVLAATITAAQAKAGTWLWPENELSTDGRFLAVVPAGVEPTLHVDGVAVSIEQIGERIENRRESAQIVAWYGVGLVPGPNRLEIRANDGFGNERTLATRTFKRPAAGVRMVLRTRQDTLPADGGRTMLPIDIVITDANGYPASGVYFVTLEATAGSFLEEDLQSREPGLQVRVEDGRGKIHVRSSDLSGRMRVTARAGALQAALELVQVAAARPLVGIGVLEVGGRFGRVDGNDDGRADLAAGFEPEARAALFLKGRVRGDAKLTLSYDTAPKADPELMRDTDPASGYATHGDASVRGFEARSRSKLYAKLERDRHSIMWGDYLTDSQADSDDLARVQRTLTGANGVFDNGQTRLQAFAARQSELRASEEIRGNGTAMLFRLDGAPIVPNSEVIERIVRDRDNPGLVLESVRLLGFSDYTLDPVTGLLSFADVVPSVNESLDPVFIRASYDRRGEVDEHTVSGLRLQHRIGRAITVGTSLTDDRNPLAGYTLAGLHLVALPTPTTRLTAAVAAQRQRDGRSDGRATRVQFEHAWSGQRDHRTLMSWARASEAFDNAGAGISAGREEWRIEHHQPLGNTLKGTLAALGSDSTGEDAGFGSIGVVFDKTFSDWSLTGGGRQLWSRQGEDRTTFRTLLLGIEKRFLFGGRAVSIGVDAERAVGDSGRFRYGVESRVQVHEHVTLHARYERERGIAAQSLLGEREGSRQLVVGVESDILPSTQVYSEYRMRGAFSGRAMESASGLRGRYELEPGLTVSPALEVIDALGGDAEDSVAVSLGASDTRNPNRKLTGQAELRQTEESRYLGVRATLAQRLDVDWTALLREEYTRQVPNVGELSSRQRFTLGLARRPKLENRHHALFLANWKQDYGPEDGQDRETHVLASHQNRELGAGATLSGRAATKWQRIRYERGTRASRAWLFDIRATVDMARRFELDLRAGWLGAGEFGDGRFSLGAGLAWIVDRNLRVGVAYNLLGFREEDLDEQGYNAQGVSIGLQWKFDEDLFQWLEE